LIALLTLTLLMGGCSDQPYDKNNVATISAPSGTSVKLDRELPATLVELPSEVAGRCAVDTVNKPLNAEINTIKRADGFSIFGWALDDKNESVPPVVVLHLAGGTGNYYAPLTRRSDREDLSKAFGKPEFKNAGYGATVDVASLPAGKYEVLIIQKSENKYLICSTKRSVDLTD
jgi:hypothetical protein